MTEASELATWFENRDRRWVARFNTVEDMGSAQGAQLSVTLTTAIHFSQPKALDAFPGDGGFERPCFTQPNRAPWLTGKTEVAYLSGAPLRAVMDLAGEVDACTDARPESQEDEVVHALRHTPEMLPESGQIRIILHAARNACGSPQERA